MGLGFVLGFGILIFVALYCCLLARVWCDVTSMAWFGFDCWFGWV